MCCKSLFDLWRKGDLYTEGDQLLRKRGGVLPVADELEWAEKIRRELAGGCPVPPPAKFDAEGCIKPETWRDRPPML